ncbi:MAG TPA: class II aldolase/adducin family protein [Polyangiaceae bacterium]|nr:class II aldolase/adducin family protein [Polyangiaceae bacterium]
MTTSLDDTIEQLVIANHILADQGVVDAFGHVSVRHPERPDRFFLSRSMAPSRVGREDIVEHDDGGAPIGANGRAAYVERFIHAEMYRSREDVMAIVHSHSPSVIPFSVSSVGLRPVYHMSSFLSRVARFEIREHFGRETDLLIRDAEKGRHLARALGDANVVLLRGHGSVAVGRDLREAVFRAFYLEVNARIQSQALALGGEIEFLTDEEAHAATEANASQTARPWDLWADEARARRAVR